MGAPCRVPCADCADCADTRSEGMAVARAEMSLGFEHATAVRVSPSNGAMTHIRSSPRRGGAPRRSCSREMPSVTSERTMCTCHWVTTMAGSRTRWCCRSSRSWSPPCSMRGQGTQTSSRSQGTSRQAQLPGSVDRGGKPCATRWLGSPADGTAARQAILVRAYEPGRRTAMFRRRAPRPVSEDLLPGPLRGGSRSRALRGRTGPGRRQEPPAPVLPSPGRFGGSAGGWSRAISGPTFDASLRDGNGRRRRARWRRLRAWGRLGQTRDLEHDTLRGLRPRHAARVLVQTT
jgi:hypothetical protein